MKSSEAQYKAEYWIKYRLEKKPYVIKLCEVCGNEFKQTGNSQKRCSTCRILKCKYCKRGFMPKGGKLRQKYCSEECFYNDTRETRTKRIISNRGTKPRTYHLNKRAKHGGVEYSEWRQKIFERDDYTCKICNRRGGKLVAHHIKPFKKNPELRLELNNGVTLCVDCHKTTDSYGWANYWKNYLSV
jgi:5-methylcytosine-specific restriction endonuclease McrA